MRRGYNIVERVRGRREERKEREKWEMFLWFVYNGCICIMKIVVNSGMCISVFILSAFKFTTSIGIHCV